MDRSRTPAKRGLPWSWILFGGCGALVYGLGFVGFDLYYEATGVAGKTWLDLAYVTGQLFTIDSGSVDGSVPWPLEIARFTAPLVAASAVLGALASLFSDELRRWTLRFRQGHVIVCGLGRTGGRLVEELHADGERVVVIEPDEHNPGLSRCRDLKVVVIPGRSDEDGTLARAAVGKAALLIATAGDDSVNVETAVRAHALAQGRGKALGNLRCVAHIADPALQQMLKAHNIYGDQNDPFDLELVNVYEVGARVLLDRAGLSAPPSSAKVRVCLVGLGHFGEAVLRRLLRDRAIRLAEAATEAATEAAEGAETAEAAPEPPVFPLDLVIVDRQAAAKDPSVRQRFREFLDGVTLHFVERDVRAPEFAGPDLAVTGPGERMDAFFICFDDDALGTLAALRIRERFGTVAPIVVRMTEEAGLAKLMDCGPAGCGPLSGIRPIGFLDIACMRDLFLGGDIELIARALHEAYLEERLAAGDPAASHPAAVPWDRLGEPFRESNRVRAKALREQLECAGLVLIPRPDRTISLHRLAPAAVETISRLEHGRWLVGKRRDGWRHGSRRDNERKLDPLLVEWEDLPEPDQESNRAAVRRLPVILAGADFEIREREEKAG